MPKLKVLSGKDVLTILGKFGFAVVTQKGSHVKLQRTMSGERQTLTIPNHKTLDTGTLQAIFRQSSRYVPEQELREYFYTTDK